MTHQAALKTALALVGCMLLVGCGGAASTASEQFQGPGGGSVGPAALVITTTDVPAGSRGIAYPTTSLAAKGATGALVWRVAHGDLPPGVWLTSDGRLIGTPASTGIFEFTAQASNGTAAAEQPLAIAVDAFGLTVVSGLQYGDAWTGRALALRCAGRKGQVQFQVETNGSNGRLDRVDATAGTAVWIPGTANVQGTIDVLRAVDTSTGETDVLELRVATDPTEQHVARFGTCDNWELAWWTKQGAHPFATDFRAALARLGLRGPSAFGAGERECDRLAELLVQVEILRHINPLFLRNADGTAGPDGLPIAFAFSQPGAGYVAPAQGRFISGRANGFSVMALCAQSGARAATGVAFGDAVGNPNHEHNAPGGEFGELGVFVNTIADLVERMFPMYGSTLTDDAVSPADVPALLALLHGRPSPGGRYDLLAYQAHAFAKSVAYVTAHEVGHSLGLAHTSQFVPGAIMNSTAILGPRADYHFTAESLAILRQGLPGAGRGGVLAPQSGPLAIAALGAAPAGIHVCGDCAGH
ncbi:MAG: matrixin family metalloprotease [Planctomycetota bacterium]|nr:matrixin family metalloprotease [Planctomycetota bacterium]